MNTLHYVYSLAYPESMGGVVFYIGKGQRARIAEHEQEIRLGKPRKGTNSYKGHVIRKILGAGEEVAKTKVAHFTTHEEAILYEIALIFFMKGYGHLTNLTEGGDGHIGYIPSPETRRLLSEAHKGITHTPESRRKMSETHRASERARAHRLDIYAARKGKPRQSPSLETRQKLRESNLGQSRSLETRRKIGEAGRGRSRKPLSEETKRKIGDANRGRKPTEEARQKMREARQRRYHKEVSN